MGYDRPVGEDKETLSHTYLLEPCISQSRTQCKMVQRVHTPALALEEWNIIVETTRKMSVCERSRKRPFERSTVGGRRDPPPTPLTYLNLQSNVINRLDHLSVEVSRWISFLWSSASVRPDALDRERPQPAEHLACRRTMDGPRPSGGVGKPSWSIGCVGNGATTYVYPA